MKTSAAITGPHLTETFLAKRLTDGTLPQEPQRHYSHASLPDKKPSTKKRHRQNSLTKTSIILSPLRPTGTPLARPPHQSKVLGDGGGGVWGGGGRTLLQKGSSSPSPIFLSPHFSKYFST